MQWPRAAGAWWPAISTASRVASRSKTSCFRPDRRRVYRYQAETAAERRGFGSRLKRPRSRRRPRLGLAAEARRHGAADAFKAGQHDSAPWRTGRGAPELDLKRPEQSLKLECAVVAPSDEIESDAQGGAAGQQDRGRFDRAAGRGDSACFGCGGGPAALPPRLFLRPTSLNH